MEKLGLCVNLRNAALTQWSDLECEGLAVTNNTLLSISADGIEQYGSDMDNTTPISAWIKTPTTNHGVPNLKRTRRALLQGRFTGKMKIETEIDDDSYEKRDFIPTGKAAKQRNLITYLSSTEQGTNFTYTLRNVNGSYFKIDSFEVLYILTERVI